MKKEGFLFDLFLEKYRFLIGGILLLLVIIGSGILIWRNNYQKPGMAAKIQKLEERVSKLESQKVEPQAVKIEENKEASPQPTAQGQVAGASSTARQEEPKNIKADASNPSQGKINLNTASEKELDSLPGIGPVYAKRIVEYRNANGPFKSVDDVKKVKGIGEKTFLKFKDNISI